MQAKQLTVTVAEVKKVKEDVFLFSFTCPYIAKHSQPGNFLHIKIDSAILRRPFSVHRVAGNCVYILFRIRGRGTKALSQYKKGRRLDIIGPLGKGFSIKRTANDERRTTILVGGGIGVAPLLFLAEKLKKVYSSQSISHSYVLLGVKNKKEILCEKEFRDLGCKILIATEDGSRGMRGTVIDLLKNLRTTNDERRTTIYACGSAEMFYALGRVLKESPNVNCEVSFEQFMGCGLGICCGCAIETKGGYKKVCNDGPVFNLEEIIGEYGPSLLE